MGYQPTLEEVKQEASRIGYECVLDDGFIQLDKLDDHTVLGGAFAESPQGIYEAWVWLQRQRLYHLQGEKVRTAPPGTRFFLKGSCRHGHEWERLRGVRGLFACREQGCLWFSVCPGCAPSVGIALHVYQEVNGVEVYWCPLHERQRREEFV